MHCLHKIHTKQLPFLVSNPSLGSGRDEIFTDALLENDILIPIMGPAGAGKSYFINSLLGAEAVEVSHEMSLGTRRLKPVIVPMEVVCQHFPCWPHEKRLILIDTPGFDDSNISEVDILTRLANWLAISYFRGMKLSGIIYLHDIHLQRMTGSAVRNQHVFEDLCGPGAFSSIVLGTTQWDTLSLSDIARAEQRESELRHSYWRDMVQHGSRVVKVKKHDPWSTIKEIRPFYETQDGLLLTIQDELVNLEMIIPQTKAGRRLRQNLEQYIIKLGETSSPQLQLHKEIQKQVDQLKLPLSKRIQDFFRL